MAKGKRQGRTRCAGLQVRLAAMAYNLRRTVILLRAVTACYGTSLPGARAPLGPRIKLVRIMVPQAFRTPLHSTTHFLAHPRTVLIRPLEEKSP